MVVPWRLAGVSALASASWDDPPYNIKELCNTFTKLYKYTLRFIARTKGQTNSKKKYITLINNISDMFYGIKKQQLFEIYETNWEKTGNTYPVRFNRLRYGFPRSVDKKIIFYPQLHLSA